MKGNNFQLVVIILFLAAAIFGVLVFSGAIPIGKSSPGTKGTVILWGTVSAQIVSPLINDFNTANPTFTMQYVQKSPDTFDKNLLEALAAGAGPDMFLLPDNLAFSYANKIFTIPYSSYPLASFKSNFAGAGQVFLTSKGVLAFPLSIDPLVMYYDRSALDASGVVYPPSYWDEFAGLVPLLDKKDASNTLIKSAVALGQFSNVDHAKDILAAFFMQTGNPIVTEKSGVFVSALGDSNNLGPVLSFYTGFADSLKNVYSWNKSLPNSGNAFSAENLAFYFGFASELQTLINKNPNQNFLVASIPQIRNSNSKLTSARVTGIAISAFSKNLNTAITAAGSMATGDFAAKFAMALGVAPARLDLLAQKPTDAYSPIFYNSALYAKSWLDPSPTDTNTIFQTMVENVLSNKMSVADAITDANAKLQLLLTQ